jgi:hypothetical protein
MLSGKTISSASAPNCNLHPKNASNCDRCALWRCRIRMRLGTRCLPCQLSANADERREPEFDLMTVRVAFDSHVVQPDGHMLSGMHLYGNAFIDDSAVAFDSPQRVLQYLGGRHYIVKQQRRVSRSSHVPFRTWFVQRTWLAKSILWREIARCTLAVIYYSIVSAAKRYFALQERDFPGEIAAGLG